MALLAAELRFFEDVIDPSKRGMQNAIRQCTRVYCLHLSTRGLRPEQESFSEFIEWMRERGPNKETYDQIVADDQKEKFDRLIDFIQERIVC